MPANLIPDQLREFSGVATTLRREADHITSVKPSRTLLHEAATAIFALLSSSSAERTEGWKDISTAPMEGGELIILGRAEQLSYSGYWDEFAQSWCEAYSERPAFPPPTHWMPLPSAPSASALDQEPTTEGTT